MRLWSNLRQPFEACKTDGLFAVKGLCLGAVILIGCLAVSPHPLRAADEVSTDKASPDRASVDPALCHMLVKHVPDADVAYQPGVDVEGNAVAPADLPSNSQIKLPEKIQIPITLNLASALHLNTNSYPYNQFGAGTEAVIGTVTLEGDKVYFNGSALSDEQQDNLSVLCMQPSE